MEQLDVDPESKHDGKITGANSLNNSISLPTKLIAAEISNQDVSYSHIPQ